MVAQAVMVGRTIDDLADTAIHPLGKDRAFTPVHTTAVNIRGGRCFFTTGCEYPTNTPQQFSCGVSFPPFVLFTADVPGCLPANGGVTLETGEYDGYCYHNPTSLNNMFNS